MRRAAVCLIVLLGVVRLAIGWRLGFHPFDDTYITFRYARNLAAGLGFVYNAGEHVLGTTTPLWALVLAGLLRAHVPIEPGSLILSLTLDIGSAIVLCRLLVRLDYSVPVGAAAAVVFLCWFDYFSLARSGMETSCFVFLTVATIYASVSARFELGAACGALACLARPEGVIVVAPLLIALWRARAAAPRRALITSLALLLIIVGGWTIYALLTFGSVVPQSVMAKAALAGDRDLARFSWSNLALFFLKGQYGGGIFERTYLQLMPVVTAAAAVGAVALLLDLIRKQDRVPPSRARFGGASPFLRVLALLFFPTCYVAGLALSHAFTFFPWYYGPIYPFAAALAMAGVAVMARGNRRVVTGACALLVCGQLASAYLVKLPADRSFWVEGYSQVAAVIPRDGGVRVAAPEIGTVGWRVWPATVLDLEGLVTPDAVGVPGDEYVRARKPDYLILRTDNAAELLARAERAPWFVQGYQLVAVRQDPYVNREFRAYRRR